jgi:hypothetical protein
MYNYFNYDAVGGIGGGWGEAQKAAADDDRLPLDSTQSAISQGTPIASSAAMNSTPKIAPSCQ